MNLVISQLHPDYFDDLAQLQYDCFPNVSADEYFTQKHFASHYKIFPEGSFVALDGRRVVGFASGLFITLDLKMPRHNLMESTGNGLYTTHQPDGKYYYAVDLGVHPDYRKRGIGSHFYQERKALVNRYNKRGIVAGAVPVNYETYRTHLNPKDYIEKVATHEIYDATLSFQVKNGFKILGLLPNYVENDFDDSAALIFWQNPNYVD